MAPAVGRLDSGSASEEDAPVELWRRMILLGCVCTAIWLAYQASLATLISVDVEDFVEEHRKESRFGGENGLLSEYIATKGRLVKVRGAAWEDFFKNVREGVGEEWTRRLPNERHPLRILFFKPDEPPLNEVSNQLSAANDVLYLTLGDAKETTYVKLTRREYSDDDFQFGSGFAPYPDPPSFLLYPYRRHSLWVLLAGLAVYVLAPRKKIPSAFGYSGWRIFLGDLVAFLIIVPFFGLPFLIVGGSLQVVKEGWPLLIFFGPLFLLGVFTLKLSAWFAGYQLLLEPGGLRVSTYRGERAYGYADMLFYQPVVFKSPRWLIVLTWIAALSGKGSARVGGIGRAMIVSAAEAGSLGISFRDGSFMYITVTDSVGSVAFKGADKVLEALRTAGVAEEKETKVIRSLGFETVGFGRA